jgi:hypothetical protein
LIKDIIVTNTCPSVDGDVTDEVMMLGSYDIDFTVMGPAILLQEVL